MKRKRIYRMHSLGIMVYALITALPLIGAVAQQNGELEIEFGMRHWSLLGCSLKLGVAVTALDLFLGFFCALYIRGSKRLSGWLRYYFVVMLPIPFYIYALSWMYIIKMLAFVWPALTRYTVSGMGACVFVETFAFLPITILFMLVGMDTIDIDKLETAVIYGGDNKAVRSVVVQSVAPYALAAAGLICVLSMTEFSVPSMFQYNTYALNIFSVYSRTGSALTAYIQCIPLMAVLVLPVIWLLKNIKNFGLKAGFKTRYLLKTTGIVKIFSIMAFVVSLLQIAVPVVTLLVMSGGIKVLLDGWSMIADELLTSFLTAFFSAIFCVLITAAPAACLGKKGNWPVWLLLYTIVIPGAIQGMGLLKVINRFGAVWLEKSLLLASLGCALKFAPFIMLWFCVARMRMDRGSIEMAEIYAVRKLDAVRIRVRMFASSYLAGFGIAFFLTFAEESVPLILMAPGKETITVKIYNYLHYGASEYVSAFSLAVVLVLFLLEGVLVLGCRLFKKGRL